MAVFTASQASKAVQVQQAALAAEQQAALISTYQWVFNIIADAAAKAQTSTTIQLTDSQWAEIGPILASNGYVTSLVTAGEYLISWAVVTITPATATTSTTPPQIVSVSPTNFNGTVGVPFSAKFTVKGGTAPYTFVPTGFAPPGLDWTYGTTSLVLSGLPAAPGSEYATLTITVTDSLSQSFSQDISWNIAPAGGTTVTIEPKTSYLGALTIALS